MAWRGLAFHCLLSLLGADSSSRCPLLWFLAFCFLCIFFWADECPSRLGAIWPFINANRLFFHLHDHVAPFRHLITIPYFRVACGSLLCTSVKPSICVLRCSLDVNNSFMFSFLSIPAHLFHRMWLIIFLSLVLKVQHRLPGLFIYWCDFQSIIIPLHIVLILHGCRFPGSLWCHYLAVFVETKS